MLLVLADSEALLRKTSSDFQRGLDAEDGNHACRADWQCASYPYMTETDASNGFSLQLYIILTFEPHHLGFLPRGKKLMS